MADWTNLGEPGTLVGSSLLLAGCSAGLGLVLLLVGGEVLLRGAVALAYRFGLSPLLIGLTVVAAATSMPELVVVVASGLEGHADLGVGNVVGSNIANTLLILGVAAMLFPISTQLRHVTRDGAIGLAAALLFIVFALIGALTWTHGLIMLALLVGYLVHSYRGERKPSNPTASPSADAVADQTEAYEPQAVKSMALIAMLIVAGIAGLVTGSKFLVDGSVEIAKAAGVSDAVIGLTLVAVGTSLPELATAVVAGIRRHSEVALGNVLGSNLFNILGIMGVLAITTPFEVGAQMLRFDVWIMAAVMALLLPIMMSSWRIGRLEGLFFLVIYAGYIGLIYFRNPVVPI